MSTNLNTSNLTGSMLIIESSRPLTLIKVAILLTAFGVCYSLNLPSIIFKAEVLLYKYTSQKVEETHQQIFQN